MKSGRIGVWVFASVKLCSNPSDMFTGTIKGPIGYMDASEAPAGASMRTLPGLEKIAPLALYLA